MSSAASGESSAEFKPGDVVRLKSGGPLMTVEYTGGENDKDVTAWFFVGHKVTRVEPSLPALMFEKVDVEAERARLRRVC